MTDKKKNIGNLLFLLLVFGLTLYGIFHGEDVGAILRETSRADVRFLLPGVLCVVFFIWGESIIIHYLMGTLGIKSPKGTCFMYSCIGFFFSCITPGASGGQPMQIYYMKKDRIPIPVSTLVLMIVTITYKSVLVFTGLYLILFQPGFVSRYLTGILPVFYLGIGLNVACCSGMLLLAFHPALAQTILLSCLRFLTRIRLCKDKPERTRKLTAAMSQYHETAAYLKCHPKVILNVTLITFLQRYALFFVTFFVYRAFGLTGTGMYDIVVLQAAISVSVDMLPLPGGMGISEKLFALIFLPIFGLNLMIPGMILSRGIAYYIQLLLSAAVTLFAHFAAGKDMACACPRAKLKEKGDTP